MFRPLDVTRMREAVAYLLGEHDTSAFRASGCQANSVKQMYDIRIRQQGELIVFTLKASAFLHHMVRNIVGSLIFVGTGKREPSWIADVLASKDRSIAAPTFMPEWFISGKIDYEEVGLPSDGEFRSSRFLISFIVFSRALYVNSQLPILKSGKMAVF